MQDDLDLHQLIHAHAKSLHINVSDAGSCVVTYIPYKKYEVNTLGAWMGGVQQARRSHLVYELERCTAVDSAVKRAGWGRGWVGHMA